MARANRVEFEMKSILQFKSVIHGRLEVEREEAKSFDKYADGTLKNNVLCIARIVE